jgi:hypothetical protein
MLLILCLLNIFLDSRFISHGSFNEIIKDTLFTSHPDLSIKFIAAFAVPQVARRSSITETFFHFSIPPFCNSIVSDQYSSQ